VIARANVAEAVSVRRCVEIGGPVASPVPPMVAPRAALSAAPVAVQAVVPLVATPEPFVQRATPLPFVQRVAAPPAPPAAPLPAIGRLIPMPCLVAGAAASGPRREAVTPPSGATFVTAEAARSVPLALIESTPFAPLPSSPFESATLESAVLESPASAPLESEVPSTIDPIAETEPEIPYVTAQLVVSTPARRARPEPDLPGVMVRPSLVLAPEQLAHDDTSSLLMLSPPSVAEFCVPPRTNDPNAPTMPRLTTRTVPLSVFSARTVPVPVHELVSPTRKTSSRLIATLGLCVVLVFAFVAGLLVTTAVVVTIDPTSCR
jgi:hypothetical protein